MTNKIDHEKRNRIERVKNYRGSFRGLDAYTGSEYLSKREEQKLLGLMQKNASGSESDSFLISFRQLIESLGWAHQKIGFEQIAKLSGVSITYQSAPTGTEIETIKMEIAVPHGDPNRIREKMILILETLLEAKRSISDLLIKHLNPKLLK